MIERVTVREGMTLYVCDGSRFKTETLSMLRCLPERREETACRSLLLSVLKHGSRTYPSLRLLNRRLDELYATILSQKNRRSGGVQRVGYGVDVLKPAYTACDLLPDALAVMTGILADPHTENGGLSPSFLTSELRDLHTSVALKRSDPRAYAAARLGEEMYGALDISYRLDEIDAILDGITAEALTAYYRNTFLRAPIDVFYIGDRSTADVADLLCRSVPSDDFYLPAPPVDVRRLPERGEVLRVSERRDLSQSWLMIGVRVGVCRGDADYLPALVLNEMLGASPVSRLMMNVREATGLCYECSSAYNRSRGCFEIATGIDASKKEDAERAIVAEIDALRRGDFSDGELLAAKKSLQNYYRSIEDAPSAIESYVLGAAGGSLPDLSAEVAALGRVTREEVSRVSSVMRVDTVYFLRGEGSTSYVPDTDE